MPRFTPQFLDELKTRLRPSDIIGRYVKLKKQGNEWAGLSPFTQEKTPSFFVNDQKGFYHCFSSGKHGDIISFLTETQKYTFYEAVERLAEEANMPLPLEEPGEEARAEKRKGLVEACEAAANFYSAMLKRADGRAGADYLAGRGVSAAAINQFRLGYAPEGRTSLKDYLINKGYAEDILVESGLLIRPDDGGSSYDRFRHRVMFPIAGSREAVIAFGGRALDPNARAKYLNSPETSIFHKGDVLYNYDRARKAADRDTALVVCEGYMDVIALSDAGFDGAVAPLGTALTEGQLALLWRAADEPVLCFDGDKAGLGAAFRAIDRALPLLKPGKSLSFAFLPDGQDPDDLVKSSGIAAFRRIIAESLPLVDVLWRRETEGKRLDTPERRAALRSHLRGMAKSIADKDVRTYYGAELARRLDEAFAPPARPARAHAAQGAGRAQQGPGRRPGITGWAQPPLPSPHLRRRGAPSNWRREGTLVLAAIHHPALIERQENAFFALSLENEALDGLLREVLSAYLTAPGLDRTGVKAHLQQTEAADTLERVLSDEALNRQTFLRPEAEIDEVEWGWSDALRHHLIATSAHRELSDSASQSFGDGEEIWKAAITAREELFNSGAERPGGKPEDGESGSQDLLSTLERMRSSVKKKSGR